jgi:hypothetical protein
MIPLFLENSMVDIDKIIITAFRTAWLQVIGPAGNSPRQIEVETARRIREALEREGIVITPSRPTCGCNQRYALQNGPLTSEIDPARDYYLD